MSPRERVTRAVHGDDDALTALVRENHARGWLLTVVRRACLRLMRPFAAERRALGERVDDAADVPMAARDPEALREALALDRN